MATATQECPTESQLNRVRRDWAEYAGESVVVEAIKGAIYGFCSELGARRIAAKYRSFEARYSESRESWFFCLELKF